MNSTLSAAQDSSVIYRLGAPPDLEMLEQLQQERLTLLRQSDPSATLTLPGTLAAWLDDAACRLIVAARPDDGRVVGFVTAWRGCWPYGALPAGLGVIDTLALDAHRYYAGLARGLARAARDWLTAHGITIIWACVPRYHAVEQAFWLSLGARALPTDAAPLPLPTTFIWMLWP